jgi:hypothetical protein
MPKDQPMKTHLLKKLASGVVGSTGAIFLNFAGATSAPAADIDFSGTFYHDNDVLLFDFTVEQASEITIFSSSWDDGGLDPILALWDANGDFITEQDDGLLTGSQVSNGVSYDYDEWDSYFTEFLTAGTYTASVGQFNNFANGSNLADGFMYDGPGNENFTAKDLCTNGSFCGIWEPNDNRTNDWTFHILGADSATVTQQTTHEDVPEPITMLGSATALGFGAVFHKSRRKNNRKRAECCAIVIRE